MRSTNLANAFALKGYNSTILVTGSVSDDVFFGHHENVEIIQLSDYIDKHCNDKEVLNYTKKLNIKIKLLKYLRYLTRCFHKLDTCLAVKIRNIRKSWDLSIFALNHQDSIYVPFGIAYYEAVYFAVKPFESKVVYSERTTPQKDFPSDKEIKKQLLEILSLANGIILQTCEQREFYKQVSVQCEVICNPVKEALADYYFGSRKPVIVNFCRVSKEKNLPLLFDAMIKLHKDYPDYILEIYGNTVEKHEEELCEEYKRLIKTMRAEEYIKILPPSKDVHKLVNDCAMFVSSSDYEGLSNSMIEAMAMGLPCVCTDCLGGGAREMIKHEENGLLVPTNDSEALYSAMKRFIEEPELAEKCSKNATKKRDELSVSAIADRWLDFINKVI